MSRYLGSFFCDLCSSGMREAVWLLEDTGQKVCGAHHLQLTGNAPPKPLSAEDLDPEPVPPAEPEWKRVVLGLRARPAQVAEHAIELQGVRNIQLDDRIATVGDGQGWVLPDVTLVELFLMASAYRNAPEVMKMQVRLQLTRLMHGKERP